MARFFRVSHNRAGSFEPTSAIFPKHVAPVVRRAADGEREIVMMSWGFMLLQNGRAPRPVTNVRDDKILTSSFWKASFEERRCLVPASSFCEPNGDVKPATWHWFSIADNELRPLFAFPGIWRRYKGPMKKDGPNVDIETYSFLTTTPSPTCAVGGWFLRFRARWCESDQGVGRFGRRIGRVVPTKGVFFLQGR